MPKVQIVTLDNELAASTAKAAPGAVDSSAVFAQERDPLHMGLHRMGPGATITIESGAIDHIVYVWRGAVTVGDVRLDERASLIVENGAAAQVTASADGASILVFHMNGAPEAPRAGGHVHLLPSDRVPRIHDMGGQGKAGGALHADAACPTCELWLHENDFYPDNHEVAVHSHTEDEIIFVRAGSIKLGNRILGPGTTLAIAANTKYGFRAGPEGLSFVNFRATAPNHVSKDGEVTDETDLWWGFVGQPDYVEMATN